MKEETYKIEVECENCGYKGSDEKPKGSTIKTIPRECPNCGCETLKEKASTMRRSF